MGRKTTVVLATVAMAAAFGCGRKNQDIWFDGDLEAARAAAGTRNTMVMAEFFTEW